MNLYPRFSGESVWEAFCNNHSLTLDEEQAFRLFLASKGWPVPETMTLDELREFWEEYCEPF